MVPLTLPQIAGLLNVFAGVMLTTAILLFTAGGILWFVRLGTHPTYRTDAITLMKWAVTVLFALVLTLMLVQFIQRHTATAVFILGFIIIGVVVWALLTQSGGGGSAPEH